MEVPRHLCPDLASGVPPPSSPSTFPPLSLLPFFPSFLFLLSPLFPLYYTSKRQTSTFFFLSFLFCIGVQTLLIGG